jgi:SAM-dependent methyltransferase
MPDFSRRSGASELMDEAGIPFAEFHDCLGELETINVLTLAYRPTLAWLGRLMRQGRAAPLRILDAGSGGGDMLRRVEKLARRLGCPAELFGVDLNPWSKRSAELTASASAIRHVTGDIFEFEPQTPVDVILCSLFTHHLSNEQIVRYLRWLDARAARGWFINDLHRHALPYYFIKLMTRLFSRNRLIRHDAAVSVARSFTVGDWQKLIRQAGLEGQAEVRWMFPFRICVSCTKKG